MSQVEVVDVKSGKLVKMADRYAKILVKMGRAKWPERVAQREPMEFVEIDNDFSPQYETVQCTAPVILISDAVREFAVSNGLDPATIKGTGANGRINRSDVIAAIGSAGERSE